MGFLESIREGLGKPGWIGSKSKRTGRKLLREADLQAYLVSRLSERYGVNTKKQAKEVLDAIEHYFIDARKNEYDATCLGWFTAHCMRKKDGNGKPWTRLVWHKPYRLAEAESIGAASKGSRKLASEKEE